MYLSDILIPDPADLLDIRSGLRNVLKRVTSENDLVLDVGAGLNADTGKHRYTTDDLLSQKVTVGIRSVCSSRKIAIFR
jgi:hypothetical protein